jgi:hypothetical protein
MMTKRVILAALCLISIAGRAARADEPTPAVRDKIEDFFEPQLVVPNRAIWHYFYARPFLSGVVWCGEVNLMNSAHVFEGFRDFYVTVFADGVHEGLVLGTRHDDPAGAEAFKFKLICGFK